MTSQFVLNFILPDRITRESNHLLREMMIRLYIQLRENLVAHVADVYHEEDGVLVIMHQLIEVSEMILEELENEYNYYYSCIVERLTENNDFDDVFDACDSFDDNAVNNTLLKLYVLDSCDSTVYQNVNLSEKFKDVFPDGKIDIHCFSNLITIAIDSLTSQIRTVNAKIPEDLKRLCVYNHDTNWSIVGNADHVEVVMSYSLAFDSF